MEWFRSVYFFFHMAHTNGFGGCSKRDATRYLSAPAALLGQAGAFQWNVFGVPYCLLKKHRHYFIITSCLNISVSLLALIRPYINSAPSIYFEKMTILQQARACKDRTHVCRAWVFSLIKKKKIKLTGEVHRVPV